MTYMDDKIQRRYNVVGFGKNETTWMTEYQAISKTEAGYEVTIAGPEVRIVEQDDTKDEFNCTCPDEFTMCDACLDFFDELLAEETPEV
jgi:hypothetical protein